MDNNTCTPAYTQTASGAPMSYLLYTFINTYVCTQYLIPYIRYLDHPLAPEGQVHRLCHCNPENQVDLRRVHTIVHIHSLYKTHTIQYVNNVQLYYTAYIFYMYKCTVRTHHVCLYLFFLVYQVCQDRHLARHHLLGLSGVDRCMSCHAHI